MKFSFLLSTLLLSSTLLSQEKPTLQQTIDWLNFYGNDVLEEGLDGVFVDNVKASYSLTVTKDSIKLHMVKTEIASDSKFSRIKVYEEFQSAPASALVLIKRANSYNLNILCNGNLVYSKTSIRYHVSSNWETHQHSTDYIGILTSDLTDPILSEKIAKFEKAMNHYIALSNPNSISEGMFDN